MFVSELLQVAITFTTNSTKVCYQFIIFITKLVVTRPITDRYYIHYKSFVTPYKGLLPVRYIITTNGLLHLTKSSLPLHYIYYKLIVTGPLPVAITFITNILLHLTKVCYQSITLITNLLLPDHYKSQLHSLQIFCYPLQKVRYKFITNLLLLDHYKSQLYRYFVTPYKRFITSSLHSLQTHSYRINTSCYYIHYK
jgi:hypothetical protein